MNKLVLIALLGAASAEQIFTAEKPHGPHHTDKATKKLEWGQHIMAACDTDKSDGLSKVEVIACVEKYTEKRHDSDNKISTKFDQADKNKDGELELQEFQSMKSKDVHLAAKAIRMEGLKDAPNKEHRTVKASKHEGGHPEKRKMKKAAKRMINQIDKIQEDLGDDTNAAEDRAEKWMHHAKSFMDKQGKKEVAARKASHEGKHKKQHKGPKKQHVAVKSANEDKDSYKSKLLNFGKKWWNKAADAEESVEKKAKKEWKSFKADHKEDATKIEDDVNGFIKEMNGDAEDLIDSLEEADKAKNLDAQKEQHFVQA